jgi:hypothetical protein
MLAFLQRRAVPGVEEVVDGVYRRSVGGRVVNLRPAGGTALERQVFDLDRDMQPIVDLLGSDPVIGQLVRADPGRGVPGTVGPNELRARAEKLLAPGGRVRFF